MDYEKKKGDRRYVAKGVLVRVDSHQMDNSVRNREILQSGEPGPAKQRIFVSQQN